MSIEGQEQQKRDGEEDGQGRKRRDDEERSGRKRREGVEDGHGRKQRSERRDDTSDSRRQRDSAEGRRWRDEDDEKELASLTLKIQQKRFYLDVKENSRGRFVKIAELTASGQKNRILMAMSVTADFKAKLNEFIEHNATLGSNEGAAVPSDGRIKSEMLSKGNRRYYIDLKENSRGRFLRIAQTVARGVRTQVAIPAQGMVEVRDQLANLLEKFGTDDMDSVVENLPASRSLRVDKKVFYFDAGVNSRGTFLRISEVRPYQRMAITLPDRAWDQVQAILSEFIHNRDEQKAKGSPGSATDASSDESVKKVTTIENNEVTVS